MLEFIFCFSVFAIVYAYVGYPLSLYLLQKTPLRRMFRTDESFKPTVSIIIAAANEERNIGDKLDNTLNLDYPRDKLQIIVASDASTDKTDQIVESYQISTDGFVQLITLAKKGGKEAAQCAALKVATGDIVVFTDAATYLEPSILKKLVRHFTNPGIGAVDGMSQVRSKESSEGAYLKYENKIREFESKLGGLVTLGGCLFAVRGWIVKAPGGFSPKMQSDFRTALVTKTANCNQELDSDFRSALATKTCNCHSIIDREAVALFDDVKDPSKEFMRKHRTVVRGFNNFFNHLYLLNVTKYGLFSYQLFCHKLLKWLVPYFMIGALVSNAVIMLTSPIWIIMMLLQVTFYWVAFIGWLTQQPEPWYKLPAFFLMSNLAILKAWYSYARGERFVTWKPSER